MKRYRGNAIAVGLLLIACTVTSILSAVPLGSMLDRSENLSQLAASDSRVIWAALLQFAWAATGAGIAIGLYPVLRRHNRRWLWDPLPGEWSRRCLSSSGHSACWSC